MPVIACCGTNENFVPSYRERGIHRESSKKLAHIRPPAGPRSIVHGLLGDSAELEAAVALRMAAAAACSSFARSAFRNSASLPLLSFIRLCDLLGLLRVHDFFSLRSRAEEDWRRHRIPLVSTARPTDSCGGDEQPDIPDLPPRKRRGLAESRSKRFLPLKIRLRICASLPLV